MWQFYYANCYAPTYISQFPWYFLFLLSQKTLFFFFQIQCKMQLLNCLLGISWSFFFLQLPLQNSLSKVRNKSSMFQVINLRTMHFLTGLILKNILIFVSFMQTFRFILLFLSLIQDGMWSQCSIILVQDCKLASKPRLINE